MTINKEILHSNNEFLQSVEVSSLFSVVFLIEEEQVDKITQEEWGIKFRLYELYLKDLDKYYWLLSERKEKQKISRLTDVLRRQKMICEYALMSEEERKELAETAESFGKKVQSSVKNIQISERKNKKIKSS
jgi:hypothetical protein